MSVHQYSFLIFFRDPIPANVISILIPLYSLLIVTTVIEKNLISS